MNADGAVIQNVEDLCLAVAAHALQEGEVTELWKALSSANWMICGPGSDLATAQGAIGGQLTDPVGRGKKVELGYH